MNTATLFPKTTEVGALTNIDDFPKVIQILETVYKEKVRLAENEKKDRAALEAEKDRSKEFCAALEVEKNRSKEFCAALEAEKNRSKEFCAALEAEKNRSKEFCAALEAEKDRSRCLDDEVGQKRHRSNELEERNSQLQAELDGKTRHLDELDIFFARFREKRQLSPTIGGCSAVHSEPSNDEMEIASIGNSPKLDDEITTSKFTFPSLAEKQDSGDEDDSEDEEIIETSENCMDTIPMVTIAKDTDDFDLFDIFGIAEYTTGETSPSEGVSSNEEKRPFKDSVIQRIDMVTGEVLGTYNTLTEAAKSIGRCHFGNISECVNNKRDSAYCFHWKRVQNNHLQNKF